MKLVLISLFTILFANTAMAGKFRYNYKNLNSLGAIICLMNTENSPTLKTHKVSSIKKKISNKKNDFEYELTGTCGTEIAKDKSVITIGEEFSIKLKSSKSSYIAFGNIGIKKIQITFREMNPIKITIQDPLLLTKMTRSMAQTKWATSNQIFSFNGDKLELKIGRKLAALEDGGKLSFKKSPTTFFNLWAESTFGCTQAGSSLSEQECEKLNTTSF